MVSGGRKGRGESRRRAGGWEGLEGGVGEEEYERVWVENKVRINKYQSVVMVAAMTPSPTITTAPIAISGEV